ncbi:unnamed protein product [Gadus morhua 'NCC']
MALLSRHETRGSECTVPERPDPEEDLLVALQLVPVRGWSSSAGLPPLVFLPWSSSAGLTPLVFLRWSNSPSLPPLVFLSWSCSSRTRSREDHRRPRKDLLTWIPGQRVRHDYSIPSGSRSPDSLFVIVCIDG